MERIRAKLKSETGASITFALLLFLVCSVLAVIILVAATTSAGRMSNLAKTDQKYYAVTSAAELLKGELDGVTVTKVRTNKSIQNEFYYVDKPASQIELTDLNNSNMDGTKFPKRVINIGDASVENMVLNVTQDGSPVRSLQVNINEAMSSIDGSIIYTITDNAENTNDHYSLELIFDVDETVQDYNSYPKGSIMEDEKYINYTKERRLSFREMKLQ